MSRPANQNMGIPCYVLCYVKASKPGKHVMTRPVNQNMGISCFVMASKPNIIGHSMLCHGQQTKIWKFYAVKAMQYVKVSKPKHWHFMLSRSANENMGILFYVMASTPKNRKSIPPWSANQNMGIPCYGMASKPNHVNLKLYPGQ